MILAHSYCPSLTDRCHRYTVSINLVHIYTYDDLGLGQLSNRNRKLKIAGCVTERYHSFARDFDILRSISKMSFLNITHQHTPTRLFYSAH